MIRYIKLFASFLLLVFCSFCSAQNKTELPIGNTKYETQEVITSYGPATSVRTILQDGKGNIWLASNEGIIRYDGKSFTTITDKLSSNRFFSAIEDKKGNFWFGTYGSGVYYYDGKSFQHFTTKEGLVSNLVFEIYEDKTGNIWFGTRGGVSRYDGTSFRNFTTKEGLPDNGINSIIEDQAGKFWFGTEGGAYVYDGRTFTSFKNKDGMAFSYVWSIIEDRKGSIWLSGGDGLWRYDGSMFTNFHKNSGLFVYEDKKRNIWNGASKGDGKFALSRYSSESLSDKKPTVIEITQSLNLFRILEANDGSIWFGTELGVYRYDGNTITDFKK
jgi:ligand-binding sensor domain-containing protein